MFLGFELLVGALPRGLVLYLQPPVLALIGLAAGAVGSRIWLPAPILNIPVPTGSKLSSLQLGDDLGQEQPRPTWWVRVLAGAAIMVIGVAAADPVRMTLQKNSAGLLRVESQGQGQFITWQLATLVVLCGGVFAAAGTGAGIRHGIFAGIRRGRRDRRMSESRRSPATDRLLADPALTRRDALYVRPILDGCLRRYRHAGDPGRLAGRLPLPPARSAAHAERLQVGLD